MQLTIRRHVSLVLVGYKVVALPLRLELSTELLGGDLGEPRSLEELLLRDLLILVH